jgi:hypothetical protein
VTPFGFSGTDTARSRSCFAIRGVLGQILSHSWAYLGVLGPVLVGLSSGQGSVQEQCRLIYIYIYIGRCYSSPKVMDLLIHHPHID